MDGTTREEEEKLNLFDREALAATRVNYLTPDNAVFTDHRGYLTVTLEDKELRVLLHRLFPYNDGNGFISVLTPELNEIGMIRDISLFSGSSREAIDRELARKYFVRKIRKILEIKDRHGITSWKVLTDGGNDPVEFTLKDTYGSMFRVTESHLIITDIDGNRFEIEDAAALDRTSFRKIELYL